MEQQARQDRQEETDPTEQQALQEAELPTEQQVLAAGIMSRAPAATTTIAAMSPAITAGQAAQEEVPTEEEGQKDALPPFWQ